MEAQPCTTYPRVIITLSPSGEVIRLDPRQQRILTVRPELSNPLHAFSFSLILRFLREDDWVRIASVSRMLLRIARSESLWRRSPWAFAAAHRGRLSTGVGRSLALRQAWLQQRDEMDSVLRLRRGLRHHFNPPTSLKALVIVQSSLGFALDRDLAAFYLTINGQPAASRGAAANFRIYSLREAVSALLELRTTAVGRHYLEVLLPGALKARADQVLPVSAPNGPSQCFVDNRTGEVLVVQPLSVTVHAKSFAKFFWTTVRFVT